MKAFAHLAKAWKFKACLKSENLVSSDTYNTLQVNLYSRQCMIIWEGKTGDTLRAPLVHRIGLFKQNFTSYATINSKGRF